MLAVLMIVIGIIVGLSDGKVKRQSRYICGVGGRQFYSDYRRFL